MLEEHVFPALRLREIIDGDTQTGNMIWRASPEKPACWNARYAGTPALHSLNKNGYRVGRIMKRQFLAHRVIWAIEYGSWPHGMIDHINGIPSDNRIENLRLTDHAGNARNSIAQRSKLGLPKGVSIGPGQITKPYRAAIKVNRRSIALGSFETPELAHERYLQACEEYGFTRRHGSGEPSAIRALRRNPKDTSHD